MWGVCTDGTLALFSNPFSLYLMITCNHITSHLIYVPQPLLPCPRVFILLTFSFANIILYIQNHFVFADNSRLGCQVFAAAELDGMVIVMPTEVNNMMK